MYGVQIIFRFLTISLVSMLLLPIVSQAQEFKNLRVGVDGTYPPFSHRNIDGVYSGIDIEIANALCKKIKSECTFQQFSWDNLVPALRGKKVDLVVASMQPNAANSKLVAFSKTYLKKSSIIIVQKDSILSSVEIDDLQDAQFGVLSSSSHGEYLRTHLKRSHINRYNKREEYLADLVNHQLDGVVGDPVLLDLWLKTEEGSQCCRVLGTLAHDPDINGIGSSIAVRSGDEKLLNAVNKALDKLEQSGETSSIIQSYLPYLLRSN